MIKWKSTDIGENLSKHNILERRKISKIIVKEYIIKQILMGLKISLEI